MKTKDIILVALVAATLFNSYKTNKLEQRISTEPFSFESMVDQVARLSVKHPELVEQYFHIKPQTRDSLLQNMMGTH